MGVPFFYAFFLNLNAFTFHCGCLQVVLSMQMEKCKNKLLYMLRMNRSGLLDTYTVKHSN